MLTVQPWKISDLQRVQPNPPALSHSWERGRLWRIYPPPRREGWHSRGGQSRASRRKRRCYAPLTASSRLCSIVGGDGGYTTRAPMQKRAGTTVALGQNVSKLLRDNLTSRVEWPGPTGGRLDNSKQGGPQ